MRVCVVLVALRFRVASGAVGAAWYLAMFPLPVNDRDHHGSDRWPLLDVEGTRGSH